MVGLLLLQVHPDQLDQYFQPHRMGQFREKKTVGDSDDLFFIVVVIVLFQFIYIHIIIYYI